MHLTVARILTFAAFAVAGGMCANGQPTLRFQRFTHTDGISDLTINSITQDSAGFLWIATRDGLNRYDGSRFKIFKHVPGDSTSLVHDNVQCVFVDSRGTLWVGTTRGLCRYDPRRFAFRHIPLASEGTSMPDVNAIAEDASGALWLAVAGVGLVQLDPLSGDVRVYRTDPSHSGSLSSNALRCLLIDATGDIWTGSMDAGLNRFDPASGLATRFLHDPRDNSSVGAGRVEALALDPKGRIWVGTEFGGLCVFDAERQNFRRFTHNAANPTSLSSNHVTNIHIDRSGAMWVGTQGGGINRSASFERLEFTSFTHNHADPSTISDDYSGSIFEDNGDILWIGTGSGLNRLLPHSIAFMHVSNKTGGPGPLASTSVKSVLKDRAGIVWAGTGNGLTRIVGSDTRHFLRGPNARQANEIAGLYEDRSGAIWIATARRGLAMIDAWSKQRAAPQFRFWTHDARDPASLSSNSILSVCEDAAGNLWVGTDGGGLNRFRGEQGRFVRYQHREDDSTSISNNSIMAIMQDSRGLIWVSTMRGLNALDPATGKCVRYLHNEADSGSLPNRAVFGAVEDRTGRIWVATARGLGVLDRFSGAFVNYFTGHGLPDVFLKGIVIDNDGTIWISSRSGLSRVMEDSTGKVTFRNYQMPDGLPVEDFSPIAYCAAADGELLFGANDGFVRFFPDDVRINREPPAIAITEMRVFGNVLPVAARTTLSSSQYDMTIEFAALEYSAPHRTRFEYMLEGLDAHWVAAGRSRSARYANLSPGEYTFRVRGANGDGVWNTTGASMSVTILPPFWATWWFRLLIVVAIAGLLALAYRYRVRHLLEVERLRTRIASDLHDDVGSALTRIAVHSEIISNTESGEKIARSSQMIGAMSREIITTLSDIVWSIDARHDSMTDLAGRLKTFALDTLGAKDIGVHFTTSGLERVHALPVDVRQNLYLIGKEAVNNIAKHSPASEAWVTLAYDTPVLRLVVRDNGTGPAAVDRSGHGFSNMRMRAERIGGRITFENANGFTVSVVVDIG